nr:hypothetical protein MtrunA17_Chr5g0448081 [Ipomoea trifida]
MHHSTSKFQSSRLLSDLVLDGLGEIIIIAFRDGGFLLGSAGEGKPHFRSEDGRDAFPDEALEGDGIDKGRELEGRLEAGRNMSVEIPICALVGLQGPPYSPLLPHLLPNLIQHIHIIHIPLHREPIQILEFHRHVRPPRLDARPECRDMRSVLQRQLFQALCLRF